MKVLSLIALATSFLYIVVVLRRTRTKMDEENLFSILVCLSLGWWAFCDAFFYSALTKESAWYWHQVGAIGWCGFIGITAWYFLAMAGVSKRMPMLAKMIYWVICGGLVLRFVTIRPTALAEDLVQSSSGLGWTFVQHYHTIWPFVLLLYLFVYLGGALAYVFIWQRKEEKESVRYLAKGFVLLDAISIAVGATSVLIIPYFTDFLPPMGSVALLIFLRGYCIELWDYDLMHIELVLDPQVILESSLEPMMITDQQFHVLYSNQSMKKMFQKESLLHISVKDLLPEGEKDLFDASNHLKERSIHNVAISLPGGGAALMSVTHVYTRRHTQLLYIISMHDISQIRQDQIQMEQMAYYDELTGLSNRRRLGELLDIWENNYKVDFNDFALIFLDLNDFKIINDKYGHDAGDQALVEVSNCLRDIVHISDETFRLSGDEFVILHLMREDEDIEVMSDYIKSQLSKIDASEFAPRIQMGASVGICLYSEYHNVRQMMKVADERMYQMKQEYHRY